MQQCQSAYAYTHSNDHAYTTVGAFVTLLIRFTHANCRYVYETAT
jgi:hypothetical protein